MGLRIKTTLARIGVVFLLLVSLGLMVRAVFNYANGKRLERYLDELREEGKSLDPRAALAPCEDRDNGALLWKAAEALLLLEGDDRAVLTEFRETLDWAEVPEAKKLRFADIAAKNGRVIDLIREASSKTCFRYDDRRHAGYQAEIPDVIKMIQAMRIFAVDALLEAEAGRVEEAVDRTVDGLRFSLLGLDEATLIEYLVAMAEAKIFLANLNRVVSGRDLPADKLTGAMSALDGAVWRRGLADALGFERLHLRLDAHIRVLRGERVPDLNSRSADRVLNWLFMPVIKAELVRDGNLWADMAETALLPYHRSEAARQRFGRTAGRGPLFRRLTELSGWAPPDISAAMLKEASLEALIDASRIGLACKIYHAQNGRFPDRIGDLVPDLLGEEPLDPFTGEPFVYRTNGDGFIVYSLGSNKKDDGGRSSPITHMVMEKDDDWSWRENRDR